MFPIYGLACLLLPVSKILQKKSVMFRGFVYATLIFSVEYITGKFLQKRALCPWDYSKSKWNIGKVIRLDYFPFWFLTGLLFERLLMESESKQATTKS